AAEEEESEDESPASSHGNLEPKLAFSGWHALSTDAKGVGSIAGATHALRDLLRACHPNSNHLGPGSSHFSVKKPAPTMPPGARELTGMFTSTTAKSGSFGTCRALFR